MAQENGHGDGSAIEFLRRDSELDAMAEGPGCHDADTTP